MITKIGIAIFHVLAFLAFIVGVINLFNASAYPGGFRLSNASAVQITQIYSQASFVMMEAIALLLVAIFIEIALYVGYPRQNQEMKNMRKDIASIRKMLTNITAIMQMEHKMKKSQKSKNAIRANKD